MFEGIEHTAIATADPESLASWYEANLGFRINHRYGGNVFVKAPDGTMLEFIPSEGERVPQSVRQPGIRHLAIAVKDFDAALDDLKKKEVVFVGEPIENGGNRLAMFQDAEGNLLHLISREVAI
jgi:glyoxylase I family protein